MKLLVGLGNPGKKYELNRHNAGFMFIDWLVNKMKNEKGKMKINESKVKLFKTDTFMNESGKAVKKLIVKCQMSNVDDLVVAHDDLDIRLADFKIQKGKGPRLHNGIESIEESLQTSDFWRIRIGVDNRTQALRLRSGRTRPLGRVRIPGVKYVLMNFSKNEMEVLNKVFEKILSSLDGLIST